MIAFRHQEYARLAAGQEIRNNMRIANSDNAGLMENPVGKLIQDHDETPLVIHSDVTSPISQLSFLRRALLFGELAMIAYLSLIHI